jgi:hypothetical protein
MVPAFAGAGIFIVRAGHPRTTTGVAGQGDTAVGLAGQAKASLTAALRAVVLATPPSGAAAPPISQMRGEGPLRSVAG